MPWTRPAEKVVTSLGVALWFAWSAPGAATGADEPRVARRGHDAVPVAGTVTYDGPIPDPIPIPEAGTVRPQIEVDPKTKGLKDAVIWLDGAPATATSGREVPEEPVVMDQQNYSFVEHLLESDRKVAGGRELGRVSENQHGLANPVARATLAEGRRPPGPPGSPRIDAGGSCRPNRKSRSTRLASPRMTTSAPLRRPGGHPDRAAAPTGSRASHPPCPALGGRATRLRSVPKTLVAHLDRSVLGPGRCQARDRRGRLESHQAGWGWLVSGRCRPGDRQRGRRRRRRGDPGDRRDRIGACHGCQEVACE
jgi:hypothetical protein